MDTSNTTITSNTVITTSDSDGNDSYDKTSAFSPRFLSTKFIIVLIITVVGCAALIMKIFDPTSFNWLAGILISGHGAGNIIDKKLNSSNQP